jgi:hypothetical protein
LAKPGRLNGEVELFDRLEGDSGPFIRVKSEDALFDDPFKRSDGEDELFVGVDGDSNPFMGADGEDALFDAQDDPIDREDEPIDWEGEEARSLDREGDPFSNCSSHDRILCVDDVFGRFVDALARLDNRSGVNDDLLETFDDGAKLLSDDAEPLTGLDGDDDELSTTLDDALSDDPEPLRDDAVPLNRLEGDDDEPFSRLDDATDPLSRLDADDDELFSRLDDDELPIRLDDDDDDGDLPNSDELLGNDDEVFAILENERTLKPDDRPLTPYPLASV